MSGAFWDAVGGASTTAAPSTIPPVEGPEGVEGPQGPPGVQGPAGATGSTGPQGLPGIAIMPEENPFEVSAIERPPGALYGYKGSVTTPAVPASTTAIANTTGVPVTAYIKGGTLTVITVGGTATGISAAASAGAAHSIPLSPNQTIAITYTVAPTWVWIGY